MRKQYFFDIRKVSKIMKENPIKKNLNWNMPCYMYKDWKIKNWETPLAHSNFSLKSLFDNLKKLEITVENSNSEYVISFEYQYPVYRNILGTYRLELWSYLKDNYPNHTSTFIVENSSWINYFVESEILLDVHENIKHFVIASERDVVEVLSPVSPNISKL